MAENCKDYRNMRAGEIAMASKVFGNAIGYGRVVIHDGGRPDASERSNAAPAYTSGEHIYFPAGSLVNYAVAPISYRATFIHELTHVWQYQSGVKVAAPSYNRLRKEKLQVALQAAIAAYENAQNDPSINDKMLERLHADIFKITESQGEDKATNSRPIPTQVVDPFVTPILPSQNIFTKFPSGDHNVAFLKNHVPSKRRSEVLWEDPDGPSQYYSSRQQMVSYWQQRQRSDYDWLKKELSKLNFYELASDQQAEAVEEYFILLEDEDIGQVNRYSISGKTRPPLSFYKNFIPFAKKGTAY